MTIGAVCIIESEKIFGFVLFECVDRRTLVTLNFTGEPNSVHAIHIHETGDVRNGCHSLGPHFNPTNEIHGSIFRRGKSRHAGDLINNLIFDENGHFHYKYFDSKIQIPQIWGRSIVIHENEDDLGLGMNEESLLTGNSGKRIAYGIIGRT